MRTFITVILATTITAAALRGDETTLLLVQPGGPGSTTAAAPVIEQLAKSLVSYEPQLAGLKALYLPSLASAADRLNAAETAYAVLSLDAFLALRQQRRLRVIAAAAPREPADLALVLLGRHSGPTLENLARGPIACASSNDIRYLTHVAFAEHAAQLNQLELIPARSALRALRALVQGQVAAAVIDGAAWRALQESSDPTLRDLAQATTLLLRAPALPRPPVVQIDGRGNALALRTALFALVADGADAALLETLAIRGFVEATDTDYAAVIAAYEDGR
jgi:hypothetical protein